ncbi:MAG: hypothetical protein KC621_24145 [Myxococcales bacterium]|nr:hypothetical protein [Myxococcales bacterium]
MIRLAPALVVQGRVLDALASVDAVTGCGGATVVDERGAFELRTEGPCASIAAWDSP